jgi:hypothetical protein
MNQLKCISIILMHLVCINVIGADDSKTVKYST